MMPLSRQEEFFVPEFNDELISNATTEVSSHADFAGAETDERETSKTRDGEHDMSERQMVKWISSLFIQ